ncbi:protein of unknown function [Methylocaldum szegediense]|uniref:Uncharacterized protein n=1 Tax=Methylocaldum szegediense TaxID=73780 RepID=A0ABM9I742_9GAMM|nr:protein of unknown function [Methylocaldum szegediense]
MVQSPLDMTLYGLGGNPEKFGDFGMGHAVESVEHEGMAGHGRKLGKRGTKALHAFCADRGILGGGRRSGEFFRNVGDVFVIAMAFLAQVVDDQIGRRAEKESARLADGRRRVREHTEKDVLDQVGRVEIAHFAAQETEQVVCVAGEPIMYGSFGHGNRRRRASITMELHSNPHATRGIIGNLRLSCRLPAAPMRQMPKRCGK